MNAWQVDFGRRIKAHERAVRRWIAVGSMVHYSPVVLQEHDGSVYEVTAIRKSITGDHVAWLAGKSGCVSLASLSRVSP